VFCGEANGSAGLVANGTLFQNNPYVFSISLFISRMMSRLIGTWLSVVTSIRPDTENPVSQDLSAEDLGPGEHLERQTWILSWRVNLFSGSGGHLAKNLKPQAQTSIQKNRRTARIRTPNTSRPSG
jgi:hypothetical protein